MNNLERALTLGAILVLVLVLIVDLSSNKSYITDSGLGSHKYKVIKGFNR